MFLICYLRRIIVASPLNILSAFGGEGISNCVWATVWERIDIIGIYGPVIRYGSRHVLAHREIGYLLPIKE